MVEFHLLKKALCRTPISQYTTIALTVIIPDRLLVEGVGSH